MNKYNESNSTHQFSKNEKLAVPNGDNIWKKGDRHALLVDCRLAEPFLSNSSCTSETVFVHMQGRCPACGYNLAHEQ